LVSAKQVSDTVFDHTSIIKTILARFCRKPDGSVPDMGARVRAAAHLGNLLGGDPRPAPAQADYQHLVDLAADWQKEFFQKSIEQQAQRSGPPELTDWQEDYLGARNALLALRGERGIAPPPPALP
jgi:phospholipase C